MTRNTMRTPMAKGGAAVEAVTGRSGDWTVAGRPAHASPSANREQWRAGSAVLLWVAVSAIGWLIAAVLALSVT